MTAFPWDRSTPPSSKGRINSILNELAAMLSKPAFFDARPAGINCQNGFISFEEGGPRLLPHAPEHRQRHVIAARWEPGNPAEIPLVLYWHGSSGGLSRAMRFA
jgi:phage/plasmid-associated DNA primase